MRTFAKHVLLSSLTVLPTAAQTVTFNFNTPVTTVNSQTDTPGTWYIDRFPPNNFVSPELAPNGTPNTLEESLAGSALQNGADNFYNTQGRKFDIDGTSVTIALYVPVQWATENARKAGFWAASYTGAYAPANLGNYPIIEFQGPITSDVANGPSYHPNGGVAGFYGWNNLTKTFDFIGLPAGFAYNTFVQLTITLVPGPPGHFVYTVGVPSNGGVSINSPMVTPTDAFIGNVFLEGYNYGFDYDIFWNGIPGVSLAADPFQVGYVSYLTVVDPIVNLTNNGASGGNICVNVYAFDPAEELLSCCSCMVTPNGLAALSIQSVFSGNTLTQEHPSSGVIELIASATPAGTSPTDAAACDAASPSYSTLLPGLRAWGTTLHVIAGSPGFGVTEHPFSVSNLSAAELTHLTSFCNFIQDYDDSAICPGCSLGALGAITSR
jgi:hypothetical protein